MKPFKDHFIAKLNEELVQPLERELGIKMENYTSLPQGQLTFAITQNGWKNTESASPAFLLLLDTKDKSSQLKTNLAEIKRKWLDSGKSIKTEKIRDVEFSILPLSDDDVPQSLKKLFSAKDEGDSAEGTNTASGSELIFGQYESLLIVGNSTKAVEKVVVRLTGGAMPSLGDLAAYESSRVSMFRDAPFFGWANMKSFIDLMVKKPSTKESDGANPMASMFNIERIVTATGLSGLKTLAFNVATSSDGASAQFALGVPESSRQGLFKLFSASGKEASPPPFVPADAVKFQRTRVDGQKAWTTIQSMLNEISPEIVTSLDFILNTANEAARQKDPSFDLKKNLFGNLGDDFISFEKASQGTTAADLKSGPSLLLIGSPQPEQFASALKAILVLMNQQGGAPKERDFLGRKIYSLPAPALPMGNAPASGTSLSYAATASYVALTTDTAMLEEFLRSADTESKSLRDKTGLTEAAAKVGGTSTGWFVYENQAETTRAMFEALRKGASDEGTAPLAPGFPAFTPENSFKDWMDGSLLPPFEKIAKYFSFSVYSGSANPDSLTFKMFSPVSPELKK